MPNRVLLKVVWEEPSTTLSIRVFWGELVGMSCSQSSAQALAQQELAGLTQGRARQ